MALLHMVWHSVVVTLYALLLSMLHYITLGCLHCITLLQCPFWSFTVDLGFDEYGLCLVIFPAV